MPRKGLVFKELFSHLSKKGKVFIAVLNNIPQGMKDGLLANLLNKKNEYICANTTYFAHVLNILDIAAK